MEGEYFPNTQLNATTTTEKFEILTKRERQQEKIYKGKLFFLFILYMFN